MDTLSLLYDLRRLKPTLQAEACATVERNGRAVRYTTVYQDLLKYILGACSGLGSAVISMTSFGKRVVIHVLRNVAGSCGRLSLGLGYEGIQATAR